MDRNEILRIYGKDYKEMTKRLLAEAGLRDLIPANARIGIKPNLMSCIPADFGATTHPEVVAGIIEYLQEAGFDRITIAEGSWVGDKTPEAFDICGYNALSARYGIPIIDTQTDGYYEVQRTVPGISGSDGTQAASASGISGSENDTSETLMELRICNCTKDFDFLINVPVVKGHCQTNITCALKNLKGLIPNSEKRHFHAMGLHRPIAILNSVIRQDFIVVDHICGDLDSEGGGNPYYSNCVMAGLDPVLMDSYVCRLLGYSLGDVPYIGMSAAAGVGCSDLSTMKLRTVDGDGIERDETLPVTHRIFRLRDRAQDVDTCSSCYESLMEALSRLEDEGLLEHFDGKVCIGQGNRGMTGEYGIGNCTRQFAHSIPGCPPAADDIYEAMKAWIVNSEQPKK